MRRDAASPASDLPDVLSEIFLLRGLDHPNQLDRAGGFVSARKWIWRGIIAPIGGLMVPDAAPSDLWASQVRESLLFGDFSRSPPS